MGSVIVYPGAQLPTHEISLSDGVQTWGLRLEGGPEAIREVPVKASPLRLSQEAAKFGDWEPGISHIEQRTWHGGRGQADFVDDPTRYFDGKMAWTMTPGKVFPVPNWKFSKPAGFFAEGYQNLPGDMAWRTLYGSYHNIAEPVTHSNNWGGCDSAWLWVRRVGTPAADLQVELWVRNLGYSDPLQVQASASVAIENVPENESCLVKVSLSGGSALVGTESFLVISGQLNDTAANHWEIGIDADGGTAFYNDGTLWHNDAVFSIYHRLLSAATHRKWHMCEYRGALYAFDELASGGNGDAFINGDRGKATGAGATWITDTNEGCAGAWTTNQWVGAYVKIVAGTGQGQIRQITGNNTSGALAVSGWDIQPDTTSEYVITYTPIWTKLADMALPIKAIAVADNVVYLAGGIGTVIRKMRFNESASPPAHNFTTDGTNEADLLFTMLDATNGLQVYATDNDAATIKRGAPAGYGTAITFGTAFDVGENDQPILNLYAHNGKLYAFKPDGRYSIAPGNTASKTLGEIGFIRSPNNGEAALSYGLYSYFSWGGYALQRLYDSSGDYDLSNIGPDRDEGLPDERRGKIVDLLGTPPGIMAAVQGDGYSSVMVLPTSGIGWHEIFRGWGSGAKIDHLHFQDSYRPRLWIAIGGELVYQDWPRHSFNPLKDAGITYHHEAVLVSSTIDMGASRLPKLVKEISAIVENLASGIEVALDYQVNQDAGTDRWIEAGSFQINPADTLPVFAGEVYRIRFRLRLRTNNEHTPPVVNATVLEGFARTPVKYQWDVQVRVSGTQLSIAGDGYDQDPDDFLTWLKEAAISSRRIHMRAIWEQMDDRDVIVEPPSLLREFTNDLTGDWGGLVQLSLREI